MLSLSLTAKIPAQTPAQTPAQEPTPTLTLPAFTGFAHPDPEGLHRRNNGTVADMLAGVVNV